MTPISSVACTSTRHSCTSPTRSISNAFMKQTRNRTQSATQKFKSETTRIYDETIQPNALVWAHVMIFLVTTLVERTLARLAMSQST